jgi:hypothetical protein
MAAEAFLYVLRCSRQGSLLRGEVVEVPMSLGGLIFHLDIAVMCISESSSLRLRTEEYAL